MQIELNGAELRYVVRTLGNMKSQVGQGFSTYDVYVKFLEAEKVADKQITIWRKTIAELEAKIKELS